MDQITITRQQYDDAINCFFEFSGYERGEGPWFLSPLWDKLKQLSEKEPEE